MARSTLDHFNSGRSCRWPASASCSHPDLDRRKSRRCCGNGMAQRQVWPCLKINSGESGSVSGCQDDSRCPELSVLDLFWLTTFCLTTSWRKYIIRKWWVERLTAASAHFVDLMQQLGDMATLKHAANLGGVVSCVFLDLISYDWHVLHRITVCCNYCWFS